MRIADFGDEYAVCFDGASERRVLVIPALFDEANKLRRFTLSVMRALHVAGIFSVLPDWPGCNESRASLREQTLSGWREAASAAARRFEATEVLAIRGGALLAPADLPLVGYAPVTGSTILRGLLRSAVISAREAGDEITRDALLGRGLTHGLVLAGHCLSAEMLAELEAAEPAASARIIAQSELGGPALWLRAEPGDDPAQTARLAALVAG